MNKLQRFWDRHGEDIVVGGIILAVLTVAIGFGYYKLHLQPKWEEQAAVARREAAESKYDEARRQELLAELKRYVDGETDFVDLSDEARQVLDEAEHFEAEYRQPLIFDEVYDLAPGLLSPAEMKRITEMPTPTPAQYEARAKDFNQKHAWMYDLEGLMSHRRYLQIDRKELYWLSEMGNRLNEVAMDDISDTVKGAPVLEDGRIAIAFSHYYGSGQTAWAANVLGYDPNSRHSSFGTAVGHLINAQGDIVQINGGIWLPSENGDPEGKEQDDPKKTYDWATVMDPPGGTKTASYGGMSVSPSVLLDLHGKPVAFQVGPTALRVTYHESGEPDRRVTDKMIDLARSIGIEGSPKKNAQWTRVNNTTWEISLDG